MGPLEIKGLILVAALGVAGLCLWIGYRLYLHGVIEKGKIVAQGGGLKVEAADYGPGVAFALLGAFIAIFAITRGMSSTTTEQWAEEDGKIIYRSEEVAAALEVEAPADNATSVAPQDETRE